MLIPYKADVYVDEQPLANVGLIVIMMLCHGAGWVLGPKSMDFMLLTADTLPVGLLLSLFLHLDLFHLLGNVLFLWTFGNAVNCRLGHARYSIVFLVLGVMAGSLHILIDGTPAAGASGAISGIVGMFLFLFPRSKTKCFWLLGWRAGSIEIPSAILIAGWFVFDVAGFALGWSQVAYVAHIAGTVAGLGAALLAVKLRLITFWMTDKPLMDV